MKIHVSSGVRTFRKDLRSVDMSLSIKSALGGATEAWLSDVARSIGPDAATYQAVQRSMPFEIGGMVYSVENEGQTRAYHKSKKIVVRAGRLEDYAPRREKAKTTLDKKIDARLAEIEKFVNLYALREEARRYMDSRLDAIERRLTDLESEGVR